MRGAGQGAPRRLRRGGLEGVRTLDLRDANAALSQVVCQAGPYPKIRTGLGARKNDTMHHKQRHLCFLALLCGRNQLIKIALVQAVLNDSVLLEFAFRKCLCDSCGHFSFVPQDLGIVEL